MLFGVAGILCLIAVAHSTVDREENSPIAKFVPKCPSTLAGVPVLQLTVDVPATAVATCRNGRKVFRSDNPVVYTLLGTFNQSYSGADCVFYRKTGGRTFTVEVQYGWGEESVKVLTHRKTLTVSCAFDAHGKALTPVKNVDLSYPAPKEEQILVGKASNVHFHLEIVDFKNKPITGNLIGVGKRIRLRVAQNSHGGVGFRVIGCVATNSVSSYAILRAGCGDGLVLPTDEGFVTMGTMAQSPFFFGFKLVGGDVLTFRCTFSVCDGFCDGDSCAMEVRKRRSNVINMTQALGDRKADGFVTKRIRFLQLDKPEKTQVVPGYPAKIPSVSLITVLSVCVPVMVMCLVLSVYVCVSHGLRRRRGESSV